MIRSIQRSTAFALAVIALAFAPSAGATTIDVDGRLDDWCVDVPGSGNHDPEDWAPGLDGVCWVAEDYVGSHGYVGPGYGGQDFDAEAMYMFLDGNTLYIALVTGFEQGGDDGYYAGDLFLDFGQDGWDTAVGMSPYREGRLYDGSNYETAEENSGLDWNMPDTPYRAEGSHYGTTAFDYRNGYNSQGDHNVYELCLELTDDQLAALCDDGIGIQWTMGCGNDVISLYCDPKVVPEPATMVLLGLGLGGIALRKRLARK